MADDENSQRDELDAALTARLRAVRPSSASPTPAPTSPPTTSSCATSTARWTTPSASRSRRGSPTTPAPPRASPSSPRRSPKAAGARRQGRSGRPPRRQSRLALRLPPLRRRPQLLARHGSAARPRAGDGRPLERAARSRKASSSSSRTTRSSRARSTRGSRSSRSRSQGRSTCELDVTQAGAPLEGVRVKLLRDGQPVDSAPTEKGRCTFSALSAARYELEIRKGGTEVGRMVLDIRGDGIAYSGTLAAHSLVKPRRQPGSTDSACRGVSTASALPAEEFM